MRRQATLQPGDGAREEEMFRSSRWETRVGASGWPIALALALTLTACGGDDNNNSTTPCTDMEFAASISTPGGGDVFLQKLPTIFSTCSSIEVLVVVNDLTGIWTVGFDLTYPDTLVRFEKATLAPLLEQGAQTPPLVLVNESPGSIQVSATRFLGDPSVDAVGPQVLMSLRFSRQSVGSGMIDFNSGGAVSNEIRDESGNVRPANFGPGHGGLLTVPL